MKNMFKMVSLTIALLSVSQMSIAANALVGNAENGSKLVAVCAACHGADGNSPSAAFPKVAGLGEKYLLNQLMAIRNMNGENPKAPSRNVVMMTGLLDGKSDQDLADIAAFYNSKEMQLSGAKKAQVQLYTGKKVDALKLGEQVFRAGNADTSVPACTGCHSPRGLGNGPAGFPRLSGQHADYIKTQLEDYRAGNRNTDGEAMVMRGVAKNLSDAEIEALANYISGLN